MRVTPIRLKNKNKLVVEYIEQQESINDLFDYHPSDDFDNRLKDLTMRNYERDTLADVLVKLNNDWDAPLETMKQIERLREENSVVIIGGQQAGLLTGPLYSLNKLISIIKLAKEQEKKLNVPVIPVFWIAGEDHDFAEINHIYTFTNKSIDKRATRQFVNNKSPISDIKLDEDLTEEWLRKVVLELPETIHTKQLYTTFTECLKKSTTYVDFFARLIFQLFPNEGVVLIDSGDERVRKIESDWFIRLIEKQPEITKAAYENIQKLTMAGYSVNVSIDRHCSNLFYHDEFGERILLIRDGDEWVGKNDEVRLTTAEIRDIAKNKPEKLSNNVITRPIMQELLFPTLAFIAGDGEINYWSILKDAFHLVDDHFYLPPIVPRLSFTYVTERIDRLMNERVLNVQTVIDQGINREKTNWLRAQYEPAIETLFNEARRSVEATHQPLRNIAEEVNNNLKQVANKNLAKIIHELDFLESKITTAVRREQKQVIAQFDEIANALHPEGGLQERIHNPYYLINLYGDQWIKKLLQQKFQFGLEHYVIYL